MNKMKLQIRFCRFKPIIQSNNQYFPHVVFCSLVQYQSGVYWFLKMSCYLNKITCSTQVTCVDFISDNQELILSLRKDEGLLFLLMAFKLKCLPQTWSLSYIYLVWVLIIAWKLTSPIVVCGKMESTQILFMMHKWGADSPLPIRSHCHLSMQMRHRVSVGPSCFLEWGVMESDYSGSHASMPLKC